MTTKKLFMLFFAITLCSCDCFLGFIGPECDDCDGCEQSSDNPNSDAIINFSFTNDGVNPTLSVDSTTGSVQIDENSTLSQSTSRFIFTFTGVTFFENKDIFAVKDVIPQVKTETGTWILDDENDFDPADSKSLDIILVLDVSGSLENNIDNVKNSAIDMIRQILFDNKDARIGVVKFSEGKVSENFSSNLTTLANFIRLPSQYTSPITSETYHLESRDATGLYEAILEGIALLETSSAKGQGIITFTDGTNNYQENANNNVSNVVITALNNTNVKHYTIGFTGNQGSIDETILSNLAINGQYASANSISNLKEVFTRFSNNIATIYDFVYETNKSPFNGEREFRLLVDLEKVN